MDTIMLARTLFGVTAGVHFWFVALTLGVTPVLAVTATVRALAPSTGRAHATSERLLGWLTRPYLINYALGIVTGLVMELQLALNWGGLTKVASDVFGTALVLETVLAFMVESTALGLWIFGWRILPRGVQAGLIWLVTIAAWVSAWFVLVANGFLHRPVGYGRTGDRLQLVDPGALFTNPSALAALAHISGAALWVGGFVLTAGAARLARRRIDFPVARAALRTGVIMVAVGSPVLVASGIGQFSWARTDPEPHVTGESGTMLALMMLVWVLVTPVTWFVLLPLLSRSRLLRMPGLLWPLAWGFPIPAAVTIMGWVYREVARQPWAITGILRTADAVTVTAGPTFTVTTVAMIMLTAGVGLLNQVLIIRALGTVPRAEPIVVDGWVETPVSLSGRSA
ncbi:cytochrome ubiquinol oxidase subunit I [Naumannella halotolerans]|uniref:Cytochrome d ubiquinol oxidase subunit I n=1 Tax=Naumannella halotolerans TaxID=993414 RepID=A0A4R7J8P1_9ACTN|nr:cytochrome ubiquinol oxidase subunit I [Naumannella halotolerans]TDT33882.1 cytochrome d ubiquinol oxidase subunit I [Naumannella halotolerans]